MDQKTVDDYVNWQGEQKCRMVTDALSGNGFAAVYCANREEARRYILEQVGEAKSVGFGGSLSVAVLSLTKELAAKGCEILNHGRPELSLEERVEIMRRQQVCDLFLSGTNALTTTGELVNIDGIGNRVAALIFGPKKTIVVAGRNKIVEGRAEDAIRRIKAWASPANAHRLGYRTPCSETGFCVNCRSDERICRATVVLDRKPRWSDIHVLVVNEDLGL